MRKTTDIRQAERFLCEAGMNPDQRGEALLRAIHSPGRWLPFSFTSGGEGRTIQVRVDRKGGEETYRVRAGK